ncbi:MAG: helix-turn-helix transcriptional regulator [Treponema sp.]|jgi:DNA-binding CsgD family transcriptional regulator|nr:helix-turn-helix transcriptional regulator [Treponema sp.]
MSNNDNVTAANLPVLSFREQEIFNKLLNGAIPKRIAHSLGISYNTFKTHQRKLYNKLGVHTVVELLSKYKGSAVELAEAAAVEVNANPQNGAQPAVFTRWRTYNDPDSHVSIKAKIEYIEEQYFTTFTIAGKLSFYNNTYAGAYAVPDPATLEAMKKMNCFSFKVLGDGNSHVVMLPTSDTRLKSDYNHYRRLFTTQKHKIQIVSINLDELVQSPYYGSPAPFIKSNIEFFQIHAYATDEFNLKIWDVRFLDA